MLPLRGAGSEPPALQLDGLTGRIRSLLTAIATTTISTFLCMSIPATV
jgi:hypothetical protein